ncbi:MULTISPECIES: ANT(4')-I family aminoglycoside nucleotidyltransferase [Paenibacillus]|uniref:ANT(4')-I family aminoglycoside nucleotidyltransferase n=1 Tax=Paenibacillus TaxID=44249 RepID=UPI002FE223BD
MRQTNGPFPMSRDSRLKIAEEIKERILETHGERVKAIGVYGSMGRGSDGSYSDLEIRCVLNSAGEEYNHEWSTGEWKAEVNFVSEDILIEDVRTIEGDWPLTHGQFLSVLPLYDPEGFFMNLKQIAISQDKVKFRDAIRGLLVEELFEYAGKWRNTEARGTVPFLPSLAVKVAEAGAMLMGLHHRICFTTGARVLSEALELPDRPEGFDRLCELVMTGSLSDPDNVLEVLEGYWKGVNGWAERNGYTMSATRRIPF